MNKTKEMVVDFRSKNKLNPLSIFGEELEVVDNYRFLGVKKYNTEAVYKRG